MGKLRGGRPAQQPPKPPRDRKPAPPYREGMFVDPLTEFYEFLAMILMPLRPKAAMYLVMPETLRDAETGEFSQGRTGAQKCAEAWDAAAKKSESVRRFLDGFLQISVWGTLAMVHIPLIVALGEKADGEGMFSGLEAMLKKHAEEETG